MTKVKVVKQMALDVAEQIAAELGDNWKVEAEGTRDIHNYGTFFLVNEGTAERLLLDSGNGRVVISGDREHLMTRELRNSVTTYDLPEPVITAALSRGPAAIAKDIQQRLLKDYRDALAVLQVRIAEQNEYNSKRQTLLDYAIRLMGGTVTAHAHREGGFKGTIGDYAAPRTIGSYTYADTSVKGYVTDDGIHIEFNSLSLAAFERMIRALKEES